jgi:hypothetical protein
VLPGRDLTVAGAGVWYPGAADPLRHLVVGPDPASDHALVWIDLRLEATRPGTSPGSRHPVLH